MFVLGSLVGCVSWWVNPTRVLKDGRGPGWSQELSAVQGTVGLGGGSSFSSRLCLPELYMYRLYMIG